MTMWGHSNKMAVSQEEDSHLDQSHTLIWDFVHTELLFKPPNLCLGFVFF